jgi:mRNA interferase MazF
MYRFRLPKGVGHEQRGARYGVIVQVDELLPRSVVIVAPTSRGAGAATCRPEIEIAGETTRVLVEQLGAVDAQRLGKRVGHLAPEEMWGVDEALMTVLGLS